MADLIQEADDALRQEKMQAMWKENAPYIIGFILGTILLTAAISGYRSWDASVKQKQTAAVITMQDAADYPNNVLQTEKLDLRKGIRAVALLQAASAFLEQDKPAEALTLYQRTAADKALKDEFQHLGGLMAARLMIDQDNQNETEILEILKPVIAAPKSPWHYHARLEAGIVQARKLNDFSAAISHLDAIIAAPELPETLYARAQNLKQLYTIEHTKTQS